MLTSPSRRVAYPGYPSSPPPSRHRSDNGRDNDAQSGSNRFTSQSPVDSPVAQHDATGLSDRLNLTYGTASSQSQPQPQAHEHYPAQQSSQTLSQRQTSHYAHPNSQSSLSSHSQPHSAVHSQSDRFPSVSSMLSSADRYPQRLDKYTFPPPPQPDRRMSEPSSHHTYGSSRQYAPQAVHLNSAYSAPQASYSLHRVNRSDSYSDLTSGPGMAAGSEWQEDEREKHVLSRDGRPSTGNLDPYSPIASTFSSSTSSIATGSLPSPHTTQSGYSTAPGGGYALYTSPEDVYNDGRPQSSSGDSSSPPYPYGSLPTVQSTAQHPGYGDPSSKTYSFVSLPGNTVRKRPRRRYDEIERLYACSFPGCTKAYGTLNHLNAHVNMQKHGSKRHPNGKQILPIELLIHYLSACCFLYAFVLFQTSARPVSSPLYLISQLWPFEVRKDRRRKRLGVLVCFVLDRKRRVLPYLAMRISIFGPSDSDR